MLAAVSTCCVTALHGDAEKEKETDNERERERERESMRCV